ncbi:MAG: hypothetical protein VYB09_05565 [Planctomycetota bacterium]|nr:hypothetical protein [Planctomycetota bacterium]
MMEQQWDPVIFRGNVEQTNHEKPQNRTRFQFFLASWLFLGVRWMEKISVSTKLLDVPINRSDRTFWFNNSGKGEAMLLFSGLRSSIRFVMEKPWMKKDFLSGIHQKPGSQLPMR